jgi:hypothetical protein
MRCCPMTLHNYAPFCAKAMTKRQRVLFLGLDTKTTSKLMRQATGNGIWMRHATQMHQLCLWYNCTPAPILQQTTCHPNETKPHACTAKGQVLWVTTASAGLPSVRALAEASSKPPTTDPQYSMPESAIPQPLIVRGAWRKE